VQWTPTARATYDRLRAKAKARREAREKKQIKKSTPDEGLFKQVGKTIYLLGNNPRHPSLNTHQYDSIENPYDKTKKVFEAYAQNLTPGAYRVFWCYGPEQQQITIVAITPHP
jgi:mRNA-degrading endonuclease RelE of RelBE toxin-antitoxin system